MGAGKWFFTRVSAYVLCHAVFSNCGIRTVGTLMYRADGFSPARPRIVFVWAHLSESLSSLSSFFQSDLITLLKLLLISQTLNILNYKTFSFRNKLSKGPKYINSISYSYEISMQIIDMILCRCLVYRKKKSDMERTV